MNPSRARDREPKAGLLALHLVLAALATTQPGCSNVRTKGLVTTPTDTGDSAADADASDIDTALEPDCNGPGALSAGCDTSQTTDATQADASDGVDDAVADTGPLPTEPCPALASPSLEGIMPCTDKNVCCSTVSQYDPCSADAQWVSAASRWQLFRFWTSESPACKKDKQAMFLPIPVDGTSTTADVLTLLWSPSCPGATHVARWAEVRFAQDGSQLGPADVILKDAPLAGSYVPCGATRVNSSEIAAVVCHNHPHFKYAPDAAKKFWSTEGMGRCCGTKNALIYRTESTLALLNILPEGYHRWGLPGVGTSEKGKWATAESILLPVMKSELAELYYATEQHYDVQAPGWVSDKRAARVYPKDSVVEILGPQTFDYSISDSSIAVADATHFAWLYDQLAPYPRSWTWDGSEWQPALVISNGSEFITTTVSDVMAGTVCAYSSLASRKDGYYFMCPGRIASLDVSGKLEWSKEASELFGGWAIGVHVEIPGPSSELYMALLREPSAWKPEASSPYQYSEARRVARIESTGQLSWTWEFQDDTAWATVENMIHQDGVLHVFGTLVPKTKDSAWALHIRLDAKTGKELCPGQMPAKP